MKITIVGGGFGGVKTALELAKHGHNSVTLISDKPDFQYYPALYGTATGKSHLQSWVPLGTIFAGKLNVDVIIDTIASVDPGTKKLTGKAGNIYEYENLVLALGSVTTYFGIQGLDHYAFGIKSESEIKKLKHHLYKEMSEQRQIDKNYVVIGGGPTGVELASSLGTYLEQLRKEYHLPKKKIAISLVEASPRLLPRMHPETSKKVQDRLEEIGVRVETGKKVESATADTLVVSGKPLKSHTIIWTSGVATNPFFANNADHFEFSKNGKVVVNQYMRTKDGIYVIGDNAFTPFSGLAQTALHDALFVTDNFKRRQQKKLLKKYKAVMPPVVVPLGEDYAVFEWKFIRLSGWPAVMLRKAADFIGYRDILPLGHALGVWRSQTVVEDDYFTPTPPKK
jgi:NADH:ubiquinone reductase (H+-translocating)